MNSCDEILSKLRSREKHQRMKNMFIKRYKDYRNCYFTTKE